MWRTASAVSQNKQNVLVQSMRLRMEKKGESIMNRSLPDKNYFIAIGVGLLVMFILLMACGACQADEPIKASWYSVESLKKEGSWKIWKGVMSNGDQFSDDGYTCASRMHSLGTILMVVNLSNSRSVIVEVTDRIGKRFAKTRIDLSKRAFSEIADLKQGLVPVRIEVLS